MLDTTHPLGAKTHFHYHYEKSINISTPTSMNTPDKIELTTTISTPTIRFQ
jgi:hypothetical protein